MSKRNRPEPRPKPETGPKSPGSKMIHRTRQIGLILAVGLIVAVVLGVTIVGNIIDKVALTSGPYYATAQAIEERIDWVHVLAVGHHDDNGVHSLEAIIDVPMYQVGQKLTELHQVVYDEMLNILDGYEDYLTILLVLGNSEDLAYRALVITSLDSVYIGQPFDIEDWMFRGQDFPMNSEAIMWP